MNKYVTYLIIILCLLGIFLGINYFFKPNMSDEIKSYLIEKGFHETEYENLFEKSESDNKKNSFSLNDYTYMLKVDETKNGMKTSLNATYDYKEEKVTYNYRVNYSNNINIFFRGEYKDNNFSCDKDFSSASLGASEMSSICELASINVKIFELEAKTLFEKNKYVDYIKSR